MCLQCNYNSFVCALILFIQPKRKEAQIIAQRQSKAKKNTKKKEDIFQLLYSMDFVRKSEEKFVKKQKFITGFSSASKNKQKEDNFFDWKSSEQNRHPQSESGCRSAKRKTQGIVYNESTVL